MEMLSRCLSACEEKIECTIHREMQDEAAKYRNVKLDGA